MRVLIVAWVHIVLVWLLRMQGFPRLRGLIECWFGCQGCLGLQVCIGSYRVGLVAKVAAYPRFSVGLVDTVLD